MGPPFGPLELDEVDGPRIDVAGLAPKHGEGLGAAGSDYPSLC
jgi:hypothetical protein